MTSRADHPGLISILMPVRNGSAYVRAAIDSILNQTYPQWELIVVDDGSTDDTQSIVDSYEEERIRTITNDSSIGVAQSLLNALEHARGEFIARMDADDICFPKRLERQVSFMAKNPEVGVLGSSCVYFGSTTTRIKFVTLRDQDIKSEMLFRSPLIHPSVMFRKSNIPFWYDPAAEYAEDYDLWVRLAAAGITFANLRTPLIRYRIHTEQVSTSKQQTQYRQAASIRQEAIRLALANPSAADSYALEQFLLAELAEPADTFVAEQLSAKLLTHSSTSQRISARSLRNRVIRELASLRIRVPRSSDHSGRLSAQEKATLRNAIAANPLNYAAGFAYGLSRRGFHAFQRLVKKGG